MTCSIPALLIALLPMVAGAPPASSPRSTIELYLKAFADGTGRYIEQAFAPTARIVFAENGQLTEWTRGEYERTFQGVAVDEYRRVRRVESVDVNETAASAVITMDYPQTLYRDYLSLVKIGDEWKIVTDVLSAEHRDVGKEAISDTLANWMLPFEPRRIVGNVYYVGNNLISSFLIATPAGHILIDTGPIQMLPQVEANMEKLGFSVKDVKVLLNSHAHFDHCGGFAEFKRRTGATVIVSKPDGELMMRGGKGDFYWGDELAYEPVHPDRFISDNERVELGGTVLTAHLTPGHTKGCTSWSMRAMENGKAYDVLFLCGLTVSPYKLTNNEQYPGVAGDIRATLMRLRGMHADVLLAAHGFWFDLEGKAARQREGSPNPFIDPNELEHHLTEMEDDFEKALAAQERQR